MILVTKLVQVLLALTPEVAAGSAVWLLRVYDPSVFVSVATALSLGSSEKMVAFVAPSAIFTLATTYTIKMLLPKEKNSVLVHWPEYFIFKVKIFCAWATALSALLVTVYVWLLMSTEPALAAFYYSLFLVPATVATATLFWGHLKVRETLDGHEA